MGSQLDYEKVMQEFEKLKEFDSWVLIELPAPDIKDPARFRFWLTRLETEWMRDFNQNKNYYANHPNWNEEDGISGLFNGIYFISKFYRFDGTHAAWSEDDFRAKRSLLIRDHYSPGDVVKVHMITNNLEEFLKSQNIVYTRKNRQLH